MGVYVFWDRFILALFALWLVVTVWNQVVLLLSFFKRRPYVRLDWDIFSLVPCWTFWANPPSNEWQLLYRDRLSDGRLTKWTTAEVVSPSSFSLIWNPSVRKWRAIRNSCSPLLRFAATGEKQNKELFVSRPYLAIAVYVSGLPGSAATDSRQFMIARTFGFDSEEDPNILFVSPSFRLEGTY